MCGWYPVPVGATRRKAGKSAVSGQADGPRGHNCAWAGWGGSTSENRNSHAGAQRERPPRQVSPSPNEMRDVSLSNAEWLARHPANRNCWSPDPSPGHRLCYASLPPGRFPAWENLPRHEGSIAS